MKHSTITLIIGLLLINLALSAAAHSSLFSDHRSFSVGDVITVLLAENTSASTSANTKTDKSFNHGMSTDGSGVMDFIPIGSMGINGNNKSEGDASTSRNAKIQGRITVKITSIDERGNLMIKGSRAVIINGEKELTNIEGVIRSQDVRSDNSIYSYNIAEAQITYTGKGDVQKGAKIGFLSKIINFIF